MTNYNISDTVSRLNSAINTRLKSVNIPCHKLNFQLIYLLYKQGVIRGFKVLQSSFRVFLKFYNNTPICYKMKIISRPGRRVYWNLNRLSKVYSRHAFSGFYVVSTSIGLVSSNDCY